MKNNKKGFTLIELIVVLAILAVIAAIAVPTAFGAITDAQTAADTASVEGFNSAIRMQATLIRGNATITAEQNKIDTAFANADIADFKPQAARKIYWVAPSATTVGHLSMTRINAADIEIDLVTTADMKTTILGKTTGKPIITTN
ncbi:MAG: prepilin-type N-terminal cleavage/methylation domain-containing protein [Oscillospiraceae bacterium]